MHGTEVVLRHANKKKKLVLIASTSEVYGKSTDVPFREDADLVLGATTRHRWAYACSKMLDEFHALAYYKERKLPVVVFRLFNTVGPRQTGQYGMVLPNFVRQALAGEPITVFGDGTQSRSFTYVGDVVRALLALMDEPTAIGQVFNIGNVEEVTIRGLAERVQGGGRVALRNRDDPLRSGLRIGIRGHAAPGARFGQDSRPDRLRAAGRPGRDHRPRPGRLPVALKAVARRQALAILSGMTRAFFTALVVLAALPASAQQLSLQIQDGLVTMTASAVPVRQVLAEWARVGGTRVVGAERIPTQP